MSAVIYRLEVNAAWNAEWKFELHVIIERGMQTLEQSERKGVRRKGCLAALMQRVQDIRHLWS